MCVRARACGYVCARACACVCARASVRARAWGVEGLCVCVCVCVGVGGGGGGGACVCVFGKNYHRYKFSSPNLNVITLKSIIFKDLLG